MSNSELYRWARKIPTLEEYIVSMTVEQWFFDKEMEVFKTAWLKHIRYHEERLSKP